MQAFAAVRAVKVRRLPDFCSDGADSHLHIMSMWVPCVTHRLK